MDIYILIIIFNEKITGHSLIRLEKGPMIDAGDSAMLRYRLPANFADKILYIIVIINL
jgi:hypothetical protein